MRIARPGRWLSASLAVTAAVSGLVFVSPPTPANAAVPYVEFVKQAYDIYKNYLSGQPGTAEQIQAAISAAEQNIIAQINAVAVSGVKACTNDTINTMKNLQQYRPDALQIQASKAASCLNQAESVITTVPANERDLAAVDTVGFALNAVGPMAVMINGFAGLSTSDLQQTLVNGDMTLFHRLAPDCFITYLGTGIPPEGPVQGRGQCYRYNAARPHHIDSNIYLANSGPGIGVTPWTVTGQKVQPVLWVGDNKINWPAAGDYGIAIDQAMAGTSYPIAINAIKRISPPIIAVPNLLGGLDEGRAASAIEAAGLVRGSVSRSHNLNVRVGKVASQNPAPGTMVAPWSTVRITVSLGPEPGSDEDQDPGGGGGGCFETCE